MATYPSFSFSEASGLGLSETRPARRAKDMRGQGLTNGVYWIQPTGSASPLRVYCDMETDEGGWMCVFTCFPRLSSCYVGTAVGGIPTPFDVTMNKFDDSVIQNMLSDGERITRTEWLHRSVEFTSVFANYGLTDGDTQWNRFASPFAWNSTSSSSGQVFERKSGSNGGWVTYTSSSGGCSGAVGGWSNYYNQSCVQSWFAGCEGGPARNHRCAGGVQDRAEKLIIWVR